jgi:hypothetical protein
MKTQIKKTSETKRIREGVYLHIASNKYISKQEGIIKNWWNVYDDKYLEKEFQDGFDLKSEAIIYLNKLSK